MVLSDSVFAYFPSAQYGESVLEKMFEKANKVVAILEIFDENLQDECNAYRKNGSRRKDAKLNLLK